jgi:hypothetical protein
MGGGGHKRTLEEIESALHTYLKKRFFTAIAIAFLTKCIRNGTKDTSTLTKLSVHFGVVCVWVKI